MSRRRLQGSRGRAIGAAAAWATQLALPAIALAGSSALPGGNGNGWHDADVFDLTAQLAPIRQALVSLPLAGALGAALSFRPRRRGTPQRTPAVIQTQVILAIVGALVMLVVGSSLARAFGIVGVASLVRYRAKVDNPKDAGVMLAALGVGLAAGVGLYLFAVFATLFLLASLWMLESIEPEARRVFQLKIAFEGTPPKPRLEELFRRLDIDYELRSASDGEVCYEVHLPLSAETARLSSAIVATAKATSVEWALKSKNGA